MKKQRENVIVGITGASGSIYARRLIEVLIAGGFDIHVVVSADGKSVVASELGAEKGEDYRRLLVPLEPSESRVIFYEPSDMFAPIASGSFKTRGMVVIPCSMSSLASISCGAGRNLIHRAADVALKERKPLVVVPRETPLNSIHLRNMLSLSEAGASILPAMPAFYAKPAKIDDLVDFIVGRCLDLLNIEHELYTPWGSF